MQNIFKLLQQNFRASTYVRKCRKLLLVLFHGFMMLCVCDVPGGHYTRSIYILTTVYGYDDSQGVVCNVVMSEVVMFIQS